MNRNPVRNAVSSVEPICRVEGFIWQQIHEAAGRFFEKPLSEEDKEDLYAHVVGKLIRVKIEHWEENAYLMEVVASSVEDGLRVLRGRPMKDGTRKSDKFESLDALAPAENDQGEYSASREWRIIEEKSSTHSNVEETLTLERVRARLSGRALAIFDWVLNGREKHNLLGLSEYCRDNWGLTEKQVIKLRQKIANAMHAEGMALAYPPPTGNARVMTPLQRREWLLAIREQKHKTLTAAAKANGVFPNQLNYHSKRLFGTSFTEFNKKAA